MKTSHLKKPKLHHSARHTMGIRVVTMLAISALLIMHLPLSYADPPTVEWQSSAGYTLDTGAADGDPNIFTITDDAANLDPDVVDTITAIASSVDTLGNVRDSIEIILSEESEFEAGIPAADSGVFRNKNIIFTAGQKEYGLDNTITIVQEDPDDFFGFDFDGPDFPDFPIAETSPETIDVIVDAFMVMSSSDLDTFGAGFTITETGPSTQIYTGTIRFSTVASDINSGTLLVRSGDIFSIHTLPGDIINGLIVPNPDPRVGVLQATVEDHIVITYAGIECVIDDMDTSFCDTVIDPGPPGAGGGGPVLPSASLVIDTLVAIFIGAGGGGGHDKTPPSLTRHIGIGVQFDPFEPIEPTGELTDSPQQAPLSINQNGYNLYGYSNTIVQNTVETGQFTDMSLVFEEASKVSHVAMYFVDQDKDEYSDKDPALIIDNGNIIKVDPEGIFGDDITLSTSKERTKSIFNFGMSFDKPTSKNLVIVAWDDKRNAGTTKIFNALEIVGDEIQNEEAHFLPIEKDGEFDFVINDDGKYVLSQPAEINKAATNSPKSIVYPDFIGRVDRHEMKILYDSIDYEKEKASSIMIQKFKLDTKLFSNQFTESKDKSSVATFFYPSNVGKLNRENSAALYDAMANEDSKANKICGKLYKTNHWKD